MISATIFCAGCIAEAAAVVQAGISGINTWINWTREPVIVKSAECEGSIEPIYPDEGYESRLTEDEKSQIAEQAVRLDELCK